MPADRRVGAAGGRGSGRALLTFINVSRSASSECFFKMEDDMRTILIAAIIVLVSGAPSPIVAQDKCPTVPRDQWMSIEALKTKVEALGYTVRRARIDDGCHKVYITEKASGGEVEAYYNPSTGELVQAKLGR